MNYYTFEIDNELKVGTEKPKGVDFAFMDNCHKLHKKALKEREESLMTPENAHLSKHPIEGYNEVTISKPVFQIAEIGQQVEIEKTGDKKCKIIKLI